MVETAFKQPQNANNYLQNNQRNCTTPTCKACSGAESRGVFGLLCLATMKESHFLTTTTKKKKIFLPGSPVTAAMNSQSHLYAAPTAARSQRRGLLPLHPPLGRKCCVYAMEFLVEFIVCLFVYYILNFKRAKYKNMYMRLHSRNITTQMRITQPGAGRIHFPVLSPFPVH